MERVVILQALVLFLIFVVFWGLSGKAFLFYGKKCIAQAERGGSAEKGAGRRGRRKKVCEGSLGRGIQGRRGQRTKPGKAGESR